MTSGSLHDDRHYKYAKTKRVETEIPGDAKEREERKQKQKQFSSSVSIMTISPRLSSSDRDCCCRTFQKRYLRTRCLKQNAKNSSYQFFKK